MTRTDVIELLTDLCPAYDKPITEDLITDWLRLLTNTDAGAARQAAEEWIDTSRYGMPKPADIRRMSKPEGRPAPLQAPIDRMRTPKTVFRVWSDDADDYVELEQPRPWDETVDGPARVAR